MKHIKRAKAPTRKQKILLDRLRMDPNGYLVIAASRSAILIQNKYTGSVIRKIIPEFLMED